MDTEFLDEPLLRSLVATLVDGFPQVRLYWLVEPGVTLLLASDRPLPVEETSAKALAALPRAFAHLAVTHPELFVGIEHS